MRSAAPKAIQHFSKNEIKLIQLICQGYQNKDIAKKFKRSLRTIEGQREVVYKKAKVKNLAKLVVYAIKNKIYKI